MSINYEVCVAVLLRQYVETLSDGQKLAGRLPLPRSEPLTK